MIKFEGNKYYDVVAAFVLIIIVFSFNIARSQAPGNNADTVIQHSADTSPKKTTDGTMAPLALQPISVKTTCDNDFQATASGGTGNYTFTSSVPSIASIGQYSGTIQLTGVAGTTQITVSDGVSSQPTQLTVTQAMTPSVNITPASVSPCQSASVTFTAHPVNAGDSPSFQWDVNGVAAGTNSNTFSSGALQTGDKVTCYLSNNNTHCIPTPLISNAATITVIPLSAPIITITSTALGPLANNTPITFNATITNGGNAPIYQWYVNDTPVGKNSPEYTSSCFYNEDVVSCMVTNTDGICLSNTTGTSNALTVYIVDSAIPVQASISVSANKVYSGEEVYFKVAVKNGNAIGFQWQVNGENVAATDSVFSTFLLKNNDKVTCIVTTDNRCNPLITTNSITMIIVPPPPISIPNTFTPNGDGINDVWDIKNLILYRYCKVLVYTRYGSLVFKSNGYSNPWDGKYKNNNLSTGTYYYVIDLGIHTREISGPVTIIH